MKGSLQLKNKSQTNSQSNTKQKSTTANTGAPNLVLISGTFTYPAINSSNT